MTDAFCQTVELRKIRVQWFGRVVHRVEDSAIQKAWGLLVDGRRQCDKEGIEDAGG